MYVNTKLGVHVTPVGAVLWEHRAGVKSNTRGVNFNTTVFAVYRVDSTATRSDPYNNSKEWIYTLEH